MPSTSGWRCGTSVLARPADATCGLLIALTCLYLIISLAGGRDWFRAPFRLRRGTYRAGGRLPHDAFEGPAEGSMRAIGVLIQSWDVQSNHR